MDKLQAGQTLGAYRIIGQIGQGGMATVYKAYHAAMDRYVAIKVLPGQLAENPEFIGRFQQEARTIANLEHPHILPVHDSGETDGVMYLVMRFLDAGTLKDRLSQGQLSLREIDRLFTQLADALGYAHERGIVHRDLKPSNILVDARGNTFLTDFGIAKMLESSSQFTSTGAMIGTPAYMSPEQAQGVKVDTRSDIYSLGIILYEMVTGRVPYEAETPLAVALKHLQEPLPLPTAVKADLPPAIERVLLKALGKQPTDRFANAAEFLEAWKQALTETSTVQGTAPAFTTQAAQPAATLSTQPPAAAVQPTPAARPLPWLWIAVGGGVLAVLLLAAAAALIVPRLRAGPRATAIAATSLAATAPPAATTAAEATAPPEPTAVEAADLPLPPAGAGRDDVRQWTPANIVYGSLVRGDFVIAWGRGGVTIWNRADGSLVRHLTTRDGLPDGDVNQVVADENRRGFWAATENGLARYEGNGWTIYTVEDGLDSNSIGALAFTSRALIIGTKYSGIDGGGLISFDGQRWEAVPGFPSADTNEQPDRLSYNVNALLFTPVDDGRSLLWAGTDNGLGMFDGDSWTRYSTDDGLPSNVIYTLSPTGQGLWIGTGAGAVVFDGSTFTRAERGTDYGVYGIVEDAEGRLWFAGDDGIWMYDPQTVNWTRFSQDTGNLDAYSIFRAARDADGTLYFGSYNGGLLVFNGEQFQAWQVPDVPSISGVSRILPAPDGSLWFIEEYGSATNRFDPQTEEWTGVDLPCDYCTPILFDAAGQLWLGGDLGLWIVNGDQVQAHLTVAEGLPSDVVLAVAQMPDGGMLVGTTGGLARLDDGAVTAVFNAENADLPSDYVRAIVTASDGSVWVGLDRGASRLLPGGFWQHFVIGDPFGEGLNAVMDLAESPDGAIWLATLGNGGWRYGDGEWIGFDLPDLLSVAAAPDGATIWFGAYYGGAFEFNGADFDDFTAEDGLPNPNVNDIYIDPDGQVWFATTGGVARYEP